MGDQVTTRFTSCPLHLLWESWPPPCLPPCLLHLCPRQMFPRRMFSRNGVTKKVARDWRSISKAAVIERKTSSSVKCRKEKNFRRSKLFGKNVKLGTISQALNATSGTKACAATLRSMEAASLVTHACSFMMIRVMRHQQQWVMTIGAFQRCHLLSHLSASLKRRKLARWNESSVRSQKLKLAWQLVNVSMSCSVRRSPRRTSC